MNESDVLLVFVASFSNHTGITPKKPTIQVDYERMALGKFHGVDVPIWGELGKNTSSFGHYFEASGRQSVLMSGDLGSIGFGYPVGLGA